MLGIRNTSSDVVEVYTSNDCLAQTNTEFHENRDFTFFVCLYVYLHLNDSIL